MQLYIDDALIEVQADAAALEKALAGFKDSKHEWLTLRKTKTERLSVLKGGGLYSVGIERNGQADVVMTPEWEMVRAAALGFLGGGKLFEGMPPGYHPDCPLCRKMGLA